MKTGPRPGAATNGDGRSFQEKAIDAWVLVPDWIEELAKVADDKGLKGTAKLLSCSPSLVSYAIANKYSGDIGRVEELVRGALMGAKVWCPGAGGDMSRKTCLDWQKKPKELCTTSGFARRMYRACRDNCPNFRAPVVKTAAPTDGGADGAH